MEKHVIDYLNSRPLNHLVEFYDKYFVQPGKWQDLMRMPGNTPFDVMKNTLLSVISAKSNVAEV